MKPASEHSLALLREEIVGGFGPVFSPDAHKLSRGTDGASFVGDRRVFILIVVRQILDGPALWITITFSVAGTKKVPLHADVCLDFEL